MKTRPLMTALVFVCARNALAAPELTTFPQIRRIGEEIEVVASGLRPHSIFTFVLKSKSNESGEHWLSTASFKSDASGRIDLRSSASHAGGYEGVDPAGLFWSQEWKSTNPHAYPDFTLLGSQSLALLDASQAPVVTKTIETIPCGRDARIEREELDASALAATVYRPSGVKTPGPSVLVLSGSEGGKAEPFACYLATKGFTAVALAYFAHPGVPQELVQIPVEYFENALDKLKDVRGYDAARLAVLGASKGGELSLVLGSYTRRFKAVVAMVPSNVVWNGIPSEGGDFNRSSWTLGGRDLPFATFDPSAVSWSKPPFVLLPGYIAGLNKANSEAIIPVENMNAPVMFLTGRDDKMWPSSEMASRAVSRLKEKGYQKEVIHLDFVGAGHISWFPYSPSTVVAMPNFVFGGNAKANAEASKAWPQIAEFLQRNL